MKRAVIIQARMSSSRLPGKVMRQINGYPLLKVMIDRLRRMHQMDDIIIATTSNKPDDAIAEWAHQQAISCYRGSEEDVLDRVLKAANEFQVDLIIETTADCPLIDPRESDKVVTKFLSGDYDYVSNVMERTYPRGMDTQVFPTSILAKVDTLTKDPIDREHVSFYIYNHPEQFRLGNVKAADSLNDPDLRLTVDTEEDFRLIESIIRNFGISIANISLERILAFLEENPKLRQLNNHIQQKQVSYG